MPCSSSGRSRETLPPIPVVSASTRDHDDIRWTREDHDRHLVHGRETAEARQRGEAGRRDGDQQHPDGRHSRGTTGSARTRDGRNGQGNMSPRRIDRLQDRLRVAELSTRALLEQAVQVCWCHDMAVAYTCALEHESDCTSKKHTPMQYIFFVGIEDLCYSIGRQQGQ